MTSIVIESNASVTRISDLNDRISNTLSATQKKWYFEFKLCRQNPASSASASSEDDVQSQQTRANTFMYTLRFSQYPGESFCLTNGTGAVLEGDFDTMLLTKLQSLWQPRQTYKGEGTEYQINDGEYTIRMANLTLLGSYKGLIVEVDYPGAKDDDRNALLDKINRTFEHLGLPISDVAVKGRMDVAWKYVEKLTR